MMLSHMLIVLAERLARRLDVRLAHYAQPVVEAVIVGSFLLVAADLFETGAPKALLVLVGLQAPDHARVPMRHLAAEELNLLAARPLHGVLEVDVLAEPHLLVKEGGAAVRGQGLALLAQAADDPGGALFSGVVGDRGVFISVRRDAVTVELSVEQSGGRFVRCSRQLELFTPQPPNSTGGAANPPPGRWRSACSGPRGTPPPAGC